MHFVSCILEILSWITAAIGDCIPLSLPFLLCLSLQPPIYAICDRKRVAWKGQSHIYSERVPWFYHLATLPTPISGAHFSWCRLPDVANCSGLMRTVVAIYTPSRQSTWDLFAANKFCHYTLLRCVPGLLASRPPSSVLSLARYSLPCCAVLFKPKHAMFLAV